MKTFLIILLLIPFSVFAQNKKFTFFSDYQFDKTYNGSKKEDFRKATISFSDPKLLTKEGTEFENLPKGNMVFKFEGLNQIKEEIIFIGKNKSGADIYAITNTETGNDIIYVIKSSHIVGKKTYGYTILLGKSDENNQGGLPKYFTAFHCNLTK